MPSTNKHNPITYYLLVFILTYVFWFMGAFYSFQEGKQVVYSLLMLLGILVPFLLSLVFVTLSSDKSLKTEFINRLFNLKRINIKFLPIIFFLMPIVVIISIGISVLFKGSISQFQFAEGFSFSAGSLPVFLLLFLAASFEELGWRGYAFDSLFERYSFFKSTIIFSILWSLWHLPLIFVNNSYQYQIFHENYWYGINFFLSIIPMGIILSWVCLKNNKSIFIAILFHLIINLSQEALQMTQLTKCIETFVLVIFATIIIVIEKEIFFGKKDYIHINN